MKNDNESIVPDASDEDRDRNAVIDSDKENDKTQDL